MMARSGSAVHHVALSDVVDEAIRKMNELRAERDQARQEAADWKALYEAAIAKATTQPPRP